jgi:hypothetical protein
MTGVHHQCLALRHIFFIHSSVNGHLSGLQIRTITAMIIGVQMSLWHPNFISFGYISISAMTGSLCEFHIIELVSFQIHFPDGSFLRNEQSFLIMSHRTSLGLWGPKENFFFCDRVSLCSPGWPQLHDPPVLSQCPECWDYRCAPPCQVSANFFLGAGLLCM